MGLTPTVLATQLCAPEGPTAAPSGWILNVCSITRDLSWPTRGGDITATPHDKPGETKVAFTTTTDEIVGIPAALAFGPDGALYVTDEGHRAIVRVDPDGTQTYLVDRYQGEPINGPNDLSFDPDGNLFFTDPWGSTAENPIGNVFGYDWSTGDLHRIDTGMGFPNGIIVREGRVYAAETLKNCVWVYNVTGPGQASNREKFCSQPHISDTPVQGPDGMAFDIEGNLWVSHFGSGHVYVYDADGTEIEKLPVGGQTPTNLCFGGPDHATLFVTVDDLGQLLAFDVGVEGDLINFCPTTRDDHPWSPMLT